MAPAFPKSEIKLGYPLYAADFVHDSNKLIVAGGGGAGRNGVNNGITLLDTSQEVVQISGAIQLSKDEDSVMSLAAGQRRGSRGTLIFAGINSEAKKGPNQHLRVFSAEEPSKAKSVLGPKISELSRSALFTDDSTDVYQRLLRLSQQFPGSPQLGACATGLAKNEQIALFDVPTGTSVVPKPRGVLGLTKEAIDLDVIQTGENEYQLLYSDGHDIFTLDVTKDKTTEPKHIYTMPTDDSLELQPALRNLRYLSTGFAFGVGNLPKSKGSILYGFRLPKPGQEGRARIALSVKLPKGFSRDGHAKATGLAVANLLPVPSPGAKQGDAQFVIAVARNDMSISLYTLEHQIVGGVDMIANLFPLKGGILKNVHRNGITGMAFSHFSPPKTSTSRIQYLKLASTSVEETVVVHTIQLKKLIDSSAPVRRGGPPRQPRYIVAAKSLGPSITGLVIITAAILVLIGVLLQGFLEVKGLAKPVVGGHYVYPKTWHAVPHKPLDGSRGGFIAKLLAEKKLVLGDNAVVLSEEPGAANDLNPDEPPPLRVDALDADVHGGARTWEDLPPAQRKLWKERLVRSGHWVEGAGETIFKGVLFGELAGAVGAVVGH